MQGKKKKKKKMGGGETAKKRKKKFSAQSSRPLQEGLTPTDPLLSYFRALGEGFYPLSCKGKKEKKKNG